MMEDLITVEKISNLPGLNIVNCETLKFLQMHMQMKHYTKARSRYIRLVAVLNTDCTKESSQ